MKSSRLVSGIIQFVTTHPWWVLFATVFLVVLMGYGLTFQKLENDYRVYFSQENPQLKAFNAIQEAYNKSDSVLFVIKPADNNVFSTQSLQVIIELTRRAWQIPYSIRVDSLTNFQYSHAIEDDLIVNDLVSNPNLTEKQLQSLKQIALNEPMLVNRLVSSQGHVSGVNVTLQLPGKDPFEVADVASYARQLVRDIEHRYPGTKVYLTGIAMMNNAFTESAFHDNKTIVPLMYLIVFIILLICLRLVSVIFVVALLIVFSILSAVGIAGWLGWYLNPTSAISPTIILTMAVADCVHILVSMIHGMRLGHAKVQAIQESLRINFQPIFLTSLTTAIGFLSMNFSDAPPFRDLGNIVTLGVILAWLFSMTLLPALLTVIPINVKSGNDPDSLIIQRLAKWVIRHRRILLFGNGVLALVLISFVPKNQLNDEFVKYFDTETEFRLSTDFLNANMGGLYSFEFSFHAPGAGDINEPLFLQSVQKLSYWLLKQPEILHVNTMTDVFKRLNKNMHGDNANWYKLPEQRDLAAQYLLMYEMSLPYGLDLNDLINIDKSSLRVIATMKSLSSNEMLAVERRVQQWLAQNMPEYRVDLASPTLMFSHIGERNIIRMVFGSIAALLLISFFLILAFKSIKLGLISLIPNLMPVGVAFGLWGLIDGQIGLGLSVVTGMTLGIVVDDTVHFISKYRRAKVEKGMSSEDAVFYAFSTVGVALWITSAVLVCGFMVLSLSHFVMNADMGLLTAITIAIALFMDLLFLPPLLLATEKKN